MASILSSHLLLLLHLLTATCVSATFFHSAYLGIRGASSMRNLQNIGEITPNFLTYHYTQTLDHFNYNPESYNTFQQRYLISNDYWGGANTSCPIIVYMGDEAPITLDASFSGFLAELALHFSALLVYIEHRYYGESMPFGSFGNDWSNTSTLGYFSSTQALADYAELIIDLKKNLSAESCPVIAVGGSYGGMLASWFRLKYPHITIGAYAASAPILYFDDLTPNDGYDKVVSNDFKIASESCYNSIRNSWHEMDKLAAQPNGLANISQLFMTCSPLNSTIGLKAYLEGIYDSSAQYDTPRDNSVSSLCNIIDAAPVGTDDLVRIAAGFNATAYHRRGSSCIYVPDDNLPFNYSGWQWQSCTEMVMPLGRGPNDTMFQAAPFDMNNYTKMCQQLFNVTPRPHWITTEFGGHNIKSVLAKFASNIIFTNGLRDPYSSGGVLFNISERVIAAYTEKGSHCLDMHPTYSDDPDWLIAQRNIVINTITGWLTDYKNQTYK